MKRCLIIYSLGNHRLKRNRILLHIRIPKLRERLAIPAADKDAEQLELSHITDGDIHGTASVERKLGHLL